MIHVFVRGRLGNQLFQYAFVRSIQECNPSVKVVYHFDEVRVQGDPSQGWENSLRWFNTNEVLESKETVPFTLIQRLVLKLYWRRFPHDGSLKEKNLYQRKWLRILNKLGLFYLDLGFFPFNKKKNGTVLISGNFESERYFENIRGILLRELTPKFDVLSKNVELLRLISSENSVCVSIRRGDFVDNPVFSKVHNICSLEYYNQAISWMIELIDNPVFFFFSDDVNWVKENVKVDHPCFYEDGTDPVWEKLRLMYSCKHFIISNSSFSWWAQYLGRYPEKIVIAPSRWYNTDFVPDLYQHNWKIVEV